MPVLRSNSRKHNGFLAAVLLCAGAGLTAQETPVPRVPPPVQNGDPAYKPFDMQHLKDIPYNGSIPKPIFPSTDRVQRSFIVEYVYDYAYSTYKPEVPLPIVSALQAKRDTPEDAVIAYYSAQRSGDWEAFLKCLDEPLQASVKTQLKDNKQTPAYWQGVWKQMFGGKQLLLVDRLETNGYLLLDVRVPGAGGTPPFPTPLKRVGLQWLVTNDLSTNPLVFNLPPKLAGDIIRVQPTPLAKMETSADVQERQAQSDFLQYHDLRESVIHAGH